MKCLKKKKIEIYKCLNENEKPDCSSGYDEDCAMYMCILEDFMNHLSLNLGGMYSMHYWNAYQFASLINRTSQST